MINKAILLYFIIVQSKWPLKLHKLLGKYMLVETYPNACIPRPKILIAGANVPEEGKGPKMGQNEFDSVRVSVVFTVIHLVFNSPYIKLVGHGSIDLLQARFIVSSTKV